MSQILRATLHFNGKKGLKLHFLIIAPSGTGKGELMKSAHYFLEKMSNLDEKRNYNTKYFSKEVTPQLLIGGCEERPVESVRIDKKRNNKKMKSTKRERVFIPGILNTCNTIFFGEAKSAIETRDSYGSFSDLLLNATDDPAIISPTARKDLKENGDMYTYTAHTSIVAGTVPTKHLSNKKFLTSGLLQRFLLGYEEFNTDDMFKLNRNVIRAGKREYVREENNEIVIRFIKTLFNKGKKSYNSQISLDLSDNELDKEIDSLHEFIKTKIKDNMGSGWKSDFIASFLNRISLYWMKIAGITASIEGRNIQNIDLRYARKIIERNMDYICRMVSEQYIESDDSSKKKRVDIILNIVKYSKSKKLTHKDMLAKLADKKKLGSWDFGRNRTITFLKEMRDDKLIKFRKVKSSNKDSYIYHM